MRFACVPSSALSIDHAQHFACSCRVLCFGKSLSIVDNDSFIATIVLLRSKNFTTPRNALSHIIRAVYIISFNGGHLWGKKKRSCQPQEQAQPQIRNGAWRAPRVSNLINNFQCAEARFHSPKQLTLFASHSPRVSWFLYSPFCAIWVRIYFSWEHLLSSRNDIQCV